MARLNNHLIKIINQTALEIAKNIIKSCSFRKRERNELFLTTEELKYVLKVVEKKEKASSYQEIVKFLSTTFRRQTGKEGFFIKFGFNNQILYFQFVYPTARKKK